jgi:Uma2 family endonuclease
LKLIQHLTVDGDCLKVCDVVHDFNRDKVFDTAAFLSIKIPSIPPNVVDSSMARNLPDTALECVMLSNKVMIEEVIRKRFTVDEYYRMAEVGILNEDSRVELIEGEIIQMPPIGNRHLACVNRANELFVSAFAGKAIVSPQNPVRLSDINEPQPDLVLLKLRTDYYVEKRIWSEDALLLVEVSDTTLRYDRHVKLPLYAKSGVPEVWIEDLQKQLLLVYRNPVDRMYSIGLTLQPDDSVSTLAFPDIAFSVRDLLLSNFASGVTT